MLVGSELSLGGATIKHDVPVYSHVLIARWLVKLTCSHLQASTGTQPKQSSLPKGETFRSNSLPLGATLGSVLAGSSGSGSSSSRGGSVSRRPRSGSSSPASPHRRGPQPPAPLLAAASEPLLSQSSVLLAHLLNTKGNKDILTYFEQTSNAFETFLIRRHLNVYLRNEWMNGRKSI